MGDQAEKGEVFPIHPLLIEMITSYAVTANPMLDAAPRLRSQWLQTVVVPFGECAVGQRSMLADVGMRGEAGGRFRP